jgi:hypothetical protein
MFTEQQLERITKIVDDVLDSAYMAAAPYLSAEALTAIKAEVFDYIDNNYDEDWSNPNVQ